MVEDTWVPGPDDTQSFSISEAVRAPVGTTLDGEALDAVRGAAMLFFAGLLFILLDFRYDGSIPGNGGFDLIPDAVGGVAILFATTRVAALARIVGPVRAGSRTVMLAVAHLLLLVPNDVPTGWFELGTSATDLVSAAQTVVALLGTALTATVLARAHDAIDQLGRRDRWARTRRWALLLAVLWVPTAFVASVAGENQPGFFGAVAGFGSVLALVAGGYTLFHLVRALAASLNVRGTFGHGEG